MVRFEKDKGINYPTLCGGSVSILLNIVLFYILFKEFNSIFQSKTIITSNVRGINIAEINEEKNNLEGVTNETLKKLDNFVF